jgi:hypothetical protein
MAWTTVKTWTTAEALGATDLNTYVRDNETYLFSGRPMIGTIGTATYTTAGTVLTDIGGEMAGTLTINSGRALFMHSGVYSHNTGVNGNMHLALDVDGTTKWDGLEVLSANAQIRSFTVPLTGLSVGSHVFKLRWSIFAGTATLAPSTSFTVLEI